MSLLRLDWSDGYRSSPLPGPAGQMWFLLKRTGLRWGLVTSYEQWTFLHLDENDRLITSPTSSANLLMLFHWCMGALESAPVSPPSVPRLDVSVGWATYDVLE